MLIRRIVIVISIIPLLFLFTACSVIGFGKKKSGNGDDGKVTVYFTKASDELGVVLIPVVREVPKDKSPYQVAIAELFLGPSLDEKEKLQLCSEIPEGSRLIKVEEDKKEIKIDISSQFMDGGGSESMQIRFRQLRETALNLAKGRPVYLYIDGALAQKIGGEGLEIKQPLNDK
jgi:spore germination protein GerM